MLRYYGSAIFHNWKCLYFCQFLLELLLRILVRKFFFPAESVCEVWKGFWCFTVITGLWTNRKKIFSLNSGRRNLFLKVWMPKAFGLVIGRYLPFFSLPTCDYSTKTLTPLFQSISSRNSIRNVTCLHAFPAFTSHRLVVTARFAVFLLWNSWCRLQ